MASVEVDMTSATGVAKQTPQFFEVAQKKTASATTIYKSRQHCRWLSARDIVIFAAFLSCGLTFYLLYAKIYSLEQQFKDQFDQLEQLQNSAARPVVMDAEGFPVIHTEHMQQQQQEMVSQSISRPGFPRLYLWQSKNTFDDVWCGDSLRPANNKDIGKYPFNCSQLTDSRWAYTVFSFDFADRAIHCI